MRRAPKSVRQQLGAIVGTFEAVVIFLGTLAAFGLRVVSPLEAFVAGAVLIAGLVVTVALLRSTVGVVVGWVVHAAVIACGFWLTPAFVVGAIFAGVWGYAMYQGTRIDARARPTEPGGPAAA